MSDLSVAKADEQRVVSVDVSREDEAEQGHDVDEHAHYSQRAPWLRAGKLTCAPHP